jgi:CelD/BcsL family acetyltransferase involved in cellulose biosynthesis
LTIIRQLRALSDFDAGRSNRGTPVEPARRSKAAVWLAASISDSGTALALEAVAMTSAVSLSMIRASRQVVPSALTLT